MAPPNSRILFNFNFKHGIVPFLHNVLSLNLLTSSFFFFNIENVNILNNSKFSWFQVEPCKGSNPAQVDITTSIQHWPFLNFAIGSNRLPLLCLRGFRNAKTPNFPLNRVILTALTYEFKFVDVISS